MTVAKMKYRSAIEAQPAIFERAIPKVISQTANLDLSGFAKAPFGLIGIGASYEVLNVAQPAFWAKGLAAHLIAPSALRLSRPETLLQNFIAVSNSGRSVEPVDFIQNNKESAFLAITGNDNNALQKASQQNINFDEQGDSTPSSFGYTCSLLAIGILLDKLTQNPNPAWSRLPEQIDSVIQSTLALKDQIIEEFAKLTAYDCVGAGSSLGTANETALLIRESMRVPAWGFDALNYLHGPMEAMDKRHGIVVIGSGREVKIAQDMAEIGAHILLITQKDVAPSANLTTLKIPTIDAPIAQEILNIIPAQVFSSLLSDHLGLTDVLFRYRQTDTKLTG